MLPTVEFTTSGFVVFEAVVVLPAHVPRFLCFVLVACKGLEITIVRHWGFGVYKGFRSLGIQSCGFLGLGLWGEENECPELPTEP